MHTPPLRNILVWMGLGLLALAAPVTAQETGSQPVMDFTLYADNPVFSRDETDCWGGEGGTIFAPQVIQAGDTLYLFFTGSCHRSAKPAGIGYATSSDGVHWDKYAQNPILAPDGTGYDAMCISMGVPLRDGDQWVLYYAGNSTPCAGPGLHIGRATAADINGPWERSAEAVLDAGKVGDWDEGFIMPHAVIKTADGYVMYYSGGGEFLLPLPRLIGMATSPDGLHWTKYDDPATTETRYAHSDPILELQADGTLDYFSAWAIDVEYTDQGWEMFFSTNCPESVSPNCPTFIGYATSEDGLRWRVYRSREKAVVTQQQVQQDWASYCVCQPAFVKRDGGYRLYFTGCTGEMNDCQIGLATGTIDWQTP